MRSVGERAIADLVALIDRLTDWESPTGNAMETNCQWCRAWIEEGDPHAADCPWVKARRIVEASR